MKESEFIEDIGDAVFRWCEANPSKAKLTEALHAAFAEDVMPSDMGLTVFAVAKRLIDVYAKEFDAVLAFSKAKAIATNFADAMSFAWDRDRGLRSSARRYLLDAARTADLFGKSPSDCGG